MPKLVWDAPKAHLYETGVKNGVLYVQDTATGTYPEGVVWNGLTSITETPSGAEATKLFADDIQYLNLYSAEEFGATIEAYTYPDEFMACDGTAQMCTGTFVGQQSRQAFGLAYKTTVGNEVAGNGLGYKIHLIYGAMASPSERAYSTINDSPEAITFSWEVTTVPTNVTNFKPTSLIVIDSTKFTTEAQKTALQSLEDQLFGKDPTTEGGSDGITANLPSPDKVYEYITGSAPTPAVG